MTTSTRDCISRSSIPWLSLIVCPVSFGWPLVGYESFRLIMFLMFLFSSPAQIQWGRRSDQWGALGLLPNTFSGGRTSPPCSHSSVGVELQIFVQPAPIICRPSGASKSRLASGRQSSQSGPQSQPVTHWLRAHASVSNTRI